MTEILEIFPLTFPNILILCISLVSIAISSLYIVSLSTPWVKRTFKDYLEPTPVYGTDPIEYFNKLLNVTPNKIKAYTPSSLYLSVVIPAMNEAERLPIMLDECCQYLSERRKSDETFTSEVIVVDDGSTDNTADVAINFRSNYDNIKVLKLMENKGKGGAVKEGVLNSSGKIILFADADGATKFEDFEKLEKEIKITSNGEIDESLPIVAIGSRSHLEAQSVAERTLFRTILMHGFHFLVYLFTVKTVKDTQCGFKLFTRSIAARLFPILHIERWAFDVELLYLCEKWNVPIREISVRWKEIEGSKVTPFWSWIQMGRDLVLIWFRYTVGIWNDKLVN